MVYALGVVLLLIGGVLFTVFSRTLYLADGASHGIYPISFDELFYWAQWAAFWITLAALILFVFCRWKGATWKLVPPVVAAGLCLHFIAYSMPLLQHRFKWQSGALGLQVFLATKRLEREANDRERQMRESFAGIWIHADGAELRISDDRARLIQAGAATELGGGSPGAYLLEPRSRVEYELARCELNNVRSALQNREYPLFLLHNQGAADSILILLEPGQLVLITPGVAPHILSRPRG